MCCARRVDRLAGSLPDDIDALRALAVNTIAERDAALAERDRLIAMNEKLRQLLRKAQGFAAKSERLAKLHLPAPALRARPADQSRRGTVEGTEAAPADVRDGDHRAVSAARELG